MKNYRLLIKLLLLAVVCAGIVFFLNSIFDSSETLRGLFCRTGSSDVIGKLAAADPATIANRELTAGRINLLIFLTVNMLQLFALVASLHVIGNIRRQDTAPQLKLTLLDNAEIFLEVPLYIGLFGTVLAFLVLSLSHSGSLLIAYSSTLIGILFSLVLRLTLYYPLRKKLITIVEGAAK
ncbi:MAG: hypothetical protein IJC73_02615 [Lentisphaeria bacterium]|nr:hypothetical protein [Lentisphaeria bacterium]